MSELINNRQQKLKELILSLHNGKDFEEAKKEFKLHFGSITTEEISQLEQALIKDGMGVEEIQKLCDVHAAVFEGSISDIHKIHDYSNTPGHPVQVFLEENERLTQLIKEEVEPYLFQKGKTPLLMLRVAFDRLKEIDKHYARKEYLFFPHLEKKGITAPPKVMWGVDDEIRRDLKEVIELLNDQSSAEDVIHAKAKALVTRVIDMVSKENNILLPLLKENLSFYNWISVDSASPEIGYFLEQPKHSWKKVEDGSVAVEPQQVPSGVVSFDTGALEISELNALLNTLPLDMTYVDKDGYVKYFSQGKERIFARPATIIGRHVSMCHPPQSVHVVEEIIESFRSGQKDHEDFWINMRGQFVYIRYFAVRDKNGQYLGTLEVTQNIKEIRELEGEKRLVSRP